MANKKIVNQKAKEVKSLAEEIKNSKVLLLCNYRGITVEQVTNLRNDLRNANAKYTVIKNNITRRALAELKISGLDDALIGPTVVITSEEDYLPALKAIYKFIKANKFYELKGGMIDGEVKEVSELLTLAQLPSREELLSKLAGLLLANISKLAVAISEVEKQKQN